MKKINLSAREMIIVGVMLISVLYGAYEFLPASSVMPGTSPVQALESSKIERVDKIIADISGVMNGEDTLRRYLYIVKRAEAAWTEDPFYEKRISDKVKEELSLTYSGYLESGGKVIAIINDAYYEVGDDVPESDCVVMKIASSNVVLRNRSKQTEIILPFLEERFSGEGVWVWKEGASAGNR